MSKDQEPPEVSLYDRMKAAGVEIDHHESDLYVPVNQTTEAIIAQYRFKSNVTRFISQIDRKPWFDIPFAYQPYWDEKTRR